MKTVFWTSWAWGLSGLYLGISVLTSYPLGLRPLVKSDLSGLSGYHAVPTLFPETSTQRSENDDGLVLAKEGPAMDSSGPVQGTKQRREIRREGPNNIENRSNINQKSVPAEPRLFVGAC